MPAQRFLKLHEAAVALMQPPRRDLGKAYALLGEANALHQRLLGGPCAEAVYNMACCLAAAASADPREGSAGLPIAPHATPEGLVEARLDLAATTLEAAVNAGYFDVANLLSDPDIEVLRQRRPRQYALALQRARCGAGCSPSVPSSNPGGAQVAFLMSPRIMQSGSLRVLGEPVRRR